MPSWKKIKLVTCVRDAKNVGVTDFVTEIKCVQNYPDFEKLAHVIQHGLQGFIVKSIEGESTEGNHLNHMWKWVCCVNKSKYCEWFHKS